VSSVEDQPTPDDVAEEKRRYMREYMRARRQSAEHGERYKAKARESMRVYMRTYNQRPGVKTATAAKSKEKRDAERTDRAALRVKSPVKFVALVIAEQGKRKDRSEYMREYQRRPEVKARRRELFELKPEEVKQKIREQGRARGQISRIAKANGIDTRTVRDILTRTAPPAEGQAA